MQKRHLLMGLLAAAVLTISARPALAQFSPLPAGAEGSGVMVLYSRSNCPSCEQQKALLGDKISQVYVVLCDANQQVRQYCRDHGVNQYPSWGVAGEMARPGMMRPR